MLNALVGIINEIIKGLWGELMRPFVAEGNKEINDPWCSFKKKWYTEQLDITGWATLQLSDVPSNFLANL